MKKIILTENVSTIHIDDVLSSDVILVKKKGKEYAAILYANNAWVCRTSVLIKTTNNLSVIIDWCGDNCEFYVLD